MLLQLVILEHFMNSTFFLCKYFVEFHSKHSRFTVRVYYASTHDVNLGEHTGSEQLSNITINEPTVI